MENVYYVIIAISYGTILPFWRVKGDGERKKKKNHYICILHEETVARQRQNGSAVIIKRNNNPLTYGTLYYS